jgi:hypothetical protein
MICLHVDRAVAAGVDARLDQDGVAAWVSGERGKLKAAAKHWMPLPLSLPKGCRDARIGKASAGTSELANAASRQRRSKQSLGRESTRRRAYLLSCPHPSRGATP